MIDEEAIKITLNRLTFSKNVAEKVIGSRKKMNDLIEKGMIRTTRRGVKENAKYFLNALDVITHASI